MMLKIALFQLTLSTISCTFLSYRVSAQVIPDNSLGNESSIVTPNAIIKDVPADLIEGGAIRDSNLFHSFSEFNVGNGNAFYFANPEGIANILTRVTGNNISEIFGTLGVDGAANLFLLNPNGIVFGENAALDVNGSFLGTTADSYIFDNGFEYSASNPNIPTLLTINMPVGLQMGNNSAGIEVRGMGSNLVLGESGLIRDERTRGLEVGKGNTLALLGGEINLTGGNLTAESGNIELGSVEAGKVTINPQEYGFSFSYEEIAEFKAINLTQASSLDTSGNGGGRFQLRGKNISILEESLIVNNTFGKSNERNSRIVATENLKLLGTEIGTLPTGIVQFVEPGATGDGGEIAIETGKLEVVQNALITNNVTGDGNGGDLKIAANTIEIDQDPATQPYPTGLFTEVLLGEGNGGDLTINGDLLIVKGRGGISSTTFGTGDGGNLTINVTNTEIIGDSVDGLFPSGLFAASEGMGNAGDLTINGDRLIVKGGGKISSTTFAKGNGGNLDINVAQIEIRGTTADGLFPSSLSSSSGGTGNAGDLTINGDLLVIKDEGQVSSTTFGKGDGGNSIINVAQTEIMGTTADGLFPSGLFAASEGMGNAGDLTINGDLLVIKDGGLISSETFGEGDGGNSIINVAQIEIMGTTADGLFLSGLFSSSSGTGNAGNLTINGDLLVIKDGGLIDSGTFVEGEGGDSNINVAQIEIMGTTTTADGLFSSGLFSSSSGTGNAGDLTINGDLLVLKDRGLISSETFGAGDGGNLTINVAETEVTGTTADGLVLSSLSSSSLGQGNAGDLTINGDRLVIKDGGQINSGAFDAGDGGNLTINVAQTEIIGTSADSLSSSGLYSASGGTGNAGDLTLNSDFILIQDGGTISSSTTNDGNAGNLDIKAQNIEVTGTSSNGDLFSQILAVSRADTPAGFLEIVTGKLNVTDGAEIAVSNTGLGDAGNLTITADEINLDRNGNLRAEVNQGERGNINLITNNLFLNNNSRIDAQAFNDATGGNIKIDNTQNIVLQGNSQINANAKQGNGGNIEINTQGYFISANSLVTASSELGLDGMVEIDEVSGDRQFELNQLPENVTDLTNLITVTCAANDNNAVAIIGNGGIPKSPYQTQSLNTTWYDLRPVRQTKAKVASLPSPLKEATATIIDANGELELIALTPLSTHRWVKSSC